MEETLSMQNGTKLTLYDRVSKLLESFQWSDCSFLIDNEVIKAHRLILAISSPVFQAMLYGPMAQVENIAVPDIEPEIFHLLLDFIYTDKVTIKSIDNACSLLYAAKKYLLPHLVELCLDYIVESTSIENVISVFNFAEWMQEQKLIIYCLNLITQHASIVLPMDGSSLSAPCLHAVLQQDRINIKEVEIIKLVFQWARNLCTKRNIASTGQNQRAVLDEENMLKELRFYALTPPEVERLPDIDNILTEPEVSAVRHIVKDLHKMKCSNELLSINIVSSDADLQALCPNIEQRGPIKINWFYCCRPMVRSVSPLVIDNTRSKVCVKIKCDKTVLINSFSIPTRMSPQITFSNESPTTYSEHIAVGIKCSDSSIRDHDSIVCNFINVVDYNSSIYIDLVQPYIFNKEQWYTVTFMWPKEKSQPYKYPISFRYMACERKVTFKFDDTCGLHNGSFLESLKFSL